MAELSHLGATGESLVEDSLVDEVIFAIFDMDMMINDLTSTRIIFGNELKGQEIL